MSGLCGIANFDGVPVAERDLQAMIEAARHRGPDGSRCAVRSNAGMGYLSLEITPESIGEVQPIVHKASGLILTADLRLDNRDELLAALRNTIGEVVPSDRTPTDAELVLAARLKWPQSHAEHLLGDFAYAVYDPDRRVLELVRDPMGLRSLYYRVEAHRVLFGTEAKQILAAPGVEKRIHEPAVFAHLSGMHPPLEMSFFHGIEQVVPGEWVTVGPAGATRRRFWDISPEAPVRRGKEADLFAGFRDVFLEAVRCRLRSTGTVGLSLSGGLDSGSIASTAGWMGQNGSTAHRSPLRAYSWAFEELASCDERETSRQVAGRYGIPVTDVPADRAWPLANLERNRPDLDDPYITYYHDLIGQVLACARNDGVRLLITGERGDAVNDHWVYDYFGLLSSGKIRVLLAELSAHGNAMGVSLPKMGKRYLLRPLLSAAGVMRDAGGTKRTRIPEYLRAEFAARAGPDDSGEPSAPVTGIRHQARRLRYELVFSSMCVHRITHLERQQAVHGIGYADPWSDRRVAEYVVSLPQHLVHRYLDFKRMTRTSLENVLPECLRRFSDTSAKANPTPLYNRGIYDRSRETVRDLLTNSRAAEHGFVDTRVLRDNYEAALRGHPEPYELWWFLTLEMWLREHWT